MNGFCPDGYVPVQEAIVRAAEYWFPEGFAALEKSLAALERSGAPQSEAKPGSNLDAVVRAFSQRQIPAGWQDDAWRAEFADLWSQTAHRLRNLLHQDTMKAYYFDNSGRQTVACNFWPTPAADGVLETGMY